MKKDYMRLEDYLEIHLNARYPNSDACQTKWYQEFIQSSVKNKMELIRENPDFAYKMFARYNDEQGLRLMIDNTELDEPTKKIAKVQLESIASSKDPINHSRSKIPQIYTDAGSSIEERGDVLRHGRSPEEADSCYHGIYEE